MPEELGEPSSLVNGLPPSQASIDPNATVIVSRPVPAIFPVKPGDFIGPYRLMESIGEGGFGTVWRSEQKEPIHREVALKVIKPGMDSSSVIARFESERQALALMDHPNIAAVLDAGTTQHGRPYFVMELVKGVPITEYCDAHQVSI
ncbi:MAG: protein kinase, partial [Verrucomicrobiaceae bacterium]